MLCLVIWLTVLGGCQRVIHGVLDAPDLSHHGWIVFSHNTWLGGTSPLLRIVADMLLFVCNLMLSFVLVLLVVSSSTPSAIAPLADILPLCYCVLAGLDTVYYTRGTVLLWLVGYLLWQHAVAAILVDNTA